MLTRARRSAALLAACFLAPLALTPTAAQAQSVEWRGFGYIHNFSEGCGPISPTGMDAVTVRYRPSGIGSNGESTTLSFFSAFYATNFRFESGRFPRNFRPVIAGQIGNFLYFWEGETRLRMLSQSPSNLALNATTPRVSLSGQIRGYVEDPDCTVDFDVTLMLRP